MFKQLSIKLAAIVTIFALGGAIFSASAQNRPISGTVVDNSGAPVIGASVFVVGNSSIGAITDLDGKFSLNVPENSRITISCIGYTTQTLSVGNQSVFNVVLAEDSEFLEETVVIGYGVQKKSDLTGSVASVGGNDLRNRSTSDAAAALQGKAAGVQILTNSGAPGTASEIRVRGYSSNSGSIGPLLIVDGLKVDNIQYLDPEMIESMEILKDAASAAIYGAQAGNGVVLITTKSGSGSKDGSIFYNAQFQLASLSNKLDIMNAEEYIAFGMANGYLTQNTLDTYYDGYTDVNWSDEVFEATWSQRHTVGFQGGNDKGSLFASINHVDNDGIFAGDKDTYKRLTFQVNADYKIKKWFTIGINNSIERWSTKSISERSDNGSAMLAAITSSPLFPVSGTYDMLSADALAYEANGYRLLTDPDTGLYWLAPKIGATQSGHPFVRRDASDVSNKGFNIRGVAYANLMPIDGLVITSRFGYRISDSNYHYYQAPYYSSATVKADNYTLTATANTSYYYQWENFANYSKSFGKHEVSVMGGMSYEETNSDNVSVTATGTDILKGYDDNFLYLDYLLEGDAVTKSVSNAPSKTASLSYFGRVSYSYDNRYSAQVNFRADAYDSSKLPKNSRWGYFPSVSAGWTISNESFFKDNVSRSAVSFLKIRASWGINGNINVLSNYPYTTSILSNVTYYQYDPSSTSVSTGSLPTGLSNSDLKWETSKQLDIGLDARFLNDRLTVGMDFYNKNTDDLLVNVSPSKSVGLIPSSDLGNNTSNYQNAGSVNNRGFELEIGWKDSVGDFSYSIDANASWLHNEVTYLEPTVGRITGTTPQGTNLSTMFEEGYSIWYLYGYEAIGVDSEGNMIYSDADGNPTTSPALTDRKYLGSSIPNFTYGITINLEYKGFDLLISGNGVSGNKIFPTSFRVDRPECNTYTWYWNNSWKQAGDEATAKFPAANLWTTEAFSSSATVFSGAYFKIKQIQLGYTLPKSITQKIKIDNLRVFVSLDNFFTFSDYIGLDPETASGNGGGTSQGIDMGTYPTAKSFILGLNLSF